MSPYKNVEKFLKHKIISRNWCDQPIICRWMTKLSMVSSMEIIDKKVGMLLAMEGGISKTKEWFLSGDDKLVTITAERYILDYLQKLNPTLQTIYKPRSVDAEYKYDGICYGIEVTCLLNTIAEWIITERVQEYFYVNKIIQNRGYKFRVSVDALENFTYQSQEKRCEIIKQIVDTVENDGVYSRDGFEVVGDTTLQPGEIVWEFEQNYVSIVDFLIKKLGDKLESKSKQLKRDNTILLVCVNSVPTVPLNPTVFQELKSPKWHEDDVNQLVDQTKQLISGTNVVGVCYFVYDLRQEAPYYDLRMISNGKLPLKI